MAPVPGLGGRGLTEPERKALRQQIAEKKAEQVKADSATQLAKDKASVKRPTKGRVVSGTRDPAQVRGGAKKDWRYRNRTGGVVQGAETSERQRKAAREAEQARRANRPSRAATPQAEKPKNSNYTPKPKKDQGPPEKRDPNGERAVLEHLGHGPKGGKGPAKGKTGPLPKTPTKPGKSTKSKSGDPIKTVDGQPWRGTDPDGRLTKNGPKEGVHYPKGGKRPTQKEWQAHRDSSRNRVLKSQPGQGANTGGTGRDADGGKGRTSFEDGRREGMAGQAKDRPPVYKPEDDGKRNYNASKASPKELHDAVKEADDETKKKIRDILNGVTKSQKIPAHGGGGIPARKKPTSTGGSSVVKGLTPRF